MLMKIRRSYEGTRTLSSFGEGVPLHTINTVCCCIRWAQYAVATIEAAMLWLCLVALQPSRS